MQIISQPCLSMYHFYKRKKSNDLFTALKEETHHTKCCLLETHWMPTCVKTMRGRPHWSGLIWAMTAILDCTLVSPMVSMLLSRGICTLSWFCRSVPPPMTADRLLTLSELWSFPSPVADTYIMSRVISMETDIWNLMHWLLFIRKILLSSTCFEHQVLIFRRT